MHFPLKISERDHPLLVAFLLAVYDVVAFGSDVFVSELLGSPQVKFIGAVCEIFGKLCRAKEQAFMSSFQTYLVRCRIWLSALLAPFLVNVNYWFGTLENSSKSALLISGSELDLLSRGEGKCQV